MKWIAAAAFGMEGLTGKDLKRLGAENVQVMNVGGATFEGTMETAMKANLWLRTCDRVSLVVGEFEARSFEELFEGVKALPWEDFIGRNTRFPVSGKCARSQLMSVRDCQAITKKAIVERLRQKYKVSWFSETKEKYQVQFAIQDDVAVLSIDTSGAGLHKRGYRPVGNAAPLRETLAAAMVQIARYRGRDVFRDPFCGSGTIPIEAALAARNRAPGLLRKFAANEWRWCPKSVWDEARTEAIDKEYHGNYDIMGSDVDPACIEIAQANAKRCGMDKVIRFEVADARGFAPAEPSGIIVSNPPYGERVMERQEAERLYRQFGAAVRNLNGWGMYLLSSHTEFERTFGRTADKKRKLYNGMIKCDLFQYRPRGDGNKVLRDRK